VVDSVGYGDQINKEESYKPIVEYVDAQFEAYLQEELKIKRCLPAYHDTRVHVCLYFICPTGHGYVRLLLVFHWSQDEWGPNNLLHVHNILLG